MKKSLVILSVFAAGLSYAQKATEIPVFTTEKEKSEWIQKNPEKYNQPLKPMEFNSKAEKQAFHADPLRERVIVADDTSFPTYINTGDKQLDDETYAAKKAQWIEQNAAKYEKMSDVKETKNAETIRAKERKEFNNQKN
jgi:hypothetical protein